MFLGNGGRAVLVDVGHVGTRVDQVADTSEGMAVVVLIVASPSQGSRGQGEDSLPSQHFSTITRININKEVALASPFEVYNINDRGRARTNSLNR